MLTLDMARREALAFVSRDFDLSAQDDHVEVVDDKTVELRQGWVFIYNSARFLRTREFGSMLMGNKPVFVDRATGKVSYLRVTGSVEEAVAALGTDRS
jgi:hypothetical protein